jgi:hydroxylamine reductase (hybrid-cluster protein)
MRDKCRSNGHAQPVTLECDGDHCIYIPYQGTGKYLIATGNGLTPFTIKDEDKLRMLAGKLGVQEQDINKMAPGSDST